MCLYVYQNQSLSHPSWKESNVVLTKRWCRITAVASEASVNPTESLGTRMGPQGCLYLRHIHSPASQSLDAGCPLKGTRLWEKQLPLADMDFQRATHLRAFSRKLLWQMPGAGGGGIWQHSIHWGSFIFHEWGYVCHCFSSPEKWIGSEWFLLRAVSILLVVSAGIISMECWEERGI